MGEEVKITVIATGFRDQSPERRSRMLSVEEESVVSVPSDSAPVASIPLVAPGDWLREPAVASASAPARFLSQDEEEDHVILADRREEPAPLSAPEFVPALADPARDAAPQAPETAAVEPETPEADGEPARPKFAELSEEPAYTPAVVDEDSNQPASDLFREPDEEAQRDLDKPAFLRRLRL
jgi:cell division protein FtsZ